MYRLKGGFSQDIFKKKKKGMYYIGHLDLGQLQTQTVS